jgi:hypothetical protein
MDWIPPPNETNGRRNLPIGAALDPKMRTAKYRSFQLRKERSKELAKHRKIFEVMESQTVTPIAPARDAFARAVLALGKFARRRFFLHDV